MYCPFCNAHDTKVTDSRLVGDGSQVRRRRECLNCHERFTTYERAELALPMVVKREGQREAFNVDKVRRGLQRALEKRKVPAAEIERVLNEIMQALRSSGEREVSSLVIGEYIMEKLRALDDVAYVRFASVYRRFQDIQEFSDEINRLKVDEPEVES